MPNRVRFDGASRRFYEVWYAIFNDLASGDGFWIRYTLLNPLDSHPEAGAGLWFGYTCKALPEASLAIRKTFPRGSFEASHGASRITIGDALFEEGRLRGGFSAAGRSVAWNLEYPPASEPHFYFGPLIRRFAESRTSVTLPGPRIELSGTVTVDGRTVAVERGPGHQAHHWGVERTPRWLWGHCCAFEEDDAVLEVLAPQGPAGLSVTFVNFRTRDRSYLASDLASLVRNRSCAGLGFWRFEGFTGRRRIVADVTVDPRHVMKFVYTSPSYRTSECWNTQVGDCLVRIYERERLERVFRARGTAAAEVHDERPERLAYPAWR